MALSFITPTIRVSGTTFSQLQAGGVAGHLDRLITAQTGLSNPSVATTHSATGGGSTGGFLAAGAYLLSYTFVNGVGETTAGTSESSTLTVSAGNIPRVTLPSLPTGATSINLYATAVGGLTGTEVLYAQGIVATTYDMSIAAPASTVTTPAANTTAISAAQKALLRRWKASGTVENATHVFAQRLSNWLQGDPIAAADARQGLVDMAVVAAMLRTLALEVGVLFEANQGTLANANNAAGEKVLRRTFA